MTTFEILTIMWFGLGFITYLVASIGSCLTGDDTFADGLRFEVLILITTTSLGGISFYQLVDSFFNKGDYFE